MDLFVELIRPGDTVVEIGGHIGYVSQFLSALVGEAGHLIVFEPGLNNRRYIRANIDELTNTTLEFSAVGADDGVATFYEDNVTGQNNSLLSDYNEAREVARSHGQELTIRPREVQVVRLDSYSHANGLRPDFVKIDAEGAELEILRGAKQTLAQVGGLMVEVLQKNHEPAIKMIEQAGLEIIVSPSGTGNFFAVRGRKG